MDIDLDTIDSKFVKKNFREGQKQAIEFAVNSFNSGKKLVILECPTGSGKSAIGMTLANMVGSSYYLTITKILQDQLVDDFGDNIVELKGRNAYPCTFYDRYGQKFVDRKLWSSKVVNDLKKDASCNNGFCRSKYNSSGDKFKCSYCFLTTGVDNTNKPVGQLTSLPVGMGFSACPYYEQVFKATRASKVVMNFSSFLFQTQMTKRFDVPRDLMIVDECHNIEPQLLDFVSFTLDDKHLSSYGIVIPQLDDAEQYRIWMEDSNIKDVIFEIIKTARKDGNAKLEDELARVLKKYQIFIENMQDTDAEWICEFELIGANKLNYRRLTLKPVFAKKFAHNLLFKYARNVLMMSATVLDVNVLCNSLGIQREHVAAYRVKNRFDKSKRPIFLDTVAKMTGGKQRMNQWGPPLLNAVNRIVKKYPGKKGIIHTHNFAIMDYILRMADSSVKSRLLDQRNFKDKKQMIEFHAESDQDTILIAPAMHEGVDLIDDLSRFQIICKVPYPNCFDDKQLARRVELDSKYYNWLTALKLIQSYGRSVRSCDDYADTYILDESIYKLMKDCGKMLPSWFVEAIVE
jgi:ATP-dependent DNA helicase DinG